MAHINFGLKSIDCKVVYYGPGMSGKTTNLEQVHELAPEDKKGSMTSVATEGDRTLFFDFMPLELGKVAGMNTKFKLYTVPGQIYYNATRKLVLQGADAVIFVADSSLNQKEANVESLDNLVENLAEHGLDIAQMPFVIQYNKRDLPEVMTVEEMEKDLNRWGVPTHEAVAFKGDGVMATLKTISKLLIQDLIEKYVKKGKGASSAQAPTPAAVPVAAPEKPVQSQPKVEQPPKPPVPKQPAASVDIPPAPPKPATKMDIPPAAKAVAAPGQKSGFFAKLFGWFKK